MLQALVVDSLIYADCNVSSPKARLSQLIPMIGFGKFSDAVLPEKFERHSVIGQILRFTQCRSSPA